MASTTTTTNSPSSSPSSSTHLQQHEDPTPTWKIDSLEYRERQFADRIIEAKTKESFNVDDRLIRQYEHEVLKQFEECANKIPTGNAMARSVFEKACAVDDNHKHYDDFQWYHRFRHERIRDSVYRRFLLTTDDEINQRKDKYEKDFKKYYANQGYQVNMSYAVENERIYQEFRSSVVNIMKTRQEREEMEKRQNA